MRLRPAATLMLLVGLAGAARAAETARQILDRRKALDDTTRHWDDRHQKMKLTIVDRRGGERVREIELFDRREPGDEQKTLLFFLAPAEVKGTGFLAFTHKGRPADQWLYLPELQRRRQITARSPSRTTSRSRPPPRARTPWSRSPTCSSTRSSIRTSSPSATSSAAGARSVTRDCRARERGHRLRFDSAPLDTGPGATDPGGGRWRHPARRRRIEAETAPPPPRTAVSGHAPSPHSAPAGSGAGSRPQGPRTPPRPRARRAARPAARRSRWRRGACRLHRAARRAPRCRARARRARDGSGGAPTCS